MKNKKSYIAKYRHEQKINSHIIYAENLREAIHIASAYEVIWGVLEDVRRFQSNLPMDESPHIFSSNKKEFKWSLLKHENN